MCSFTACSKNQQCKALYERIVAKGKSKKLALIAVTNKLLKQSFAIAQSGIRYNPEYKSLPGIQ
jgi:transposase